MRRFGFIGALLVAIGILIALSSPILANTLPTGPMVGSNGLATVTTTLYPAADAYVSSSYPTTNYGTSTSLRVDGSPTVRSYLRFSVSNTSSISKATLRIYANSALSSGISVNRTGSSWGETTINYGNAPAVGSLVKTSAAVSAYTWISVDVTSYVNANGTFSFALTDPSSTALSLASRESTNKPQLVITYGGTAPTPTPASVPSVTPVPAPGTDPYIFFTGDSRSGCTTAAQNVVNLIKKYPSSVPVLFNGDATNTGAYSEFTDCFNTTYGQIKSQLRPVPGNHEYLTSGASGYYSYFGSQAGPSGKGYYSYNVGTWHLINLNSEIDISSTSAQLSWLKTDLANNPASCTLAIWHRPRFSSGEHGDSSDTGSLFTALYNAGAEIVLSGHDHDYERFAPQNPSGSADSARGIRQWVVGTAGVAMRSFSTIRANSQFRNNTNYGALKLTLHSSSYDWQFINTSGSIIDSGSTACH